jgi:hypothetical protein
MPFAVSPTLPIVPMETGAVHRAAIIITTTIAVQLVAIASSNQMKSVMEIVPLRATTPIYVQSIPSTVQRQTAMPSAATLT